MSIVPGMFNKSVTEHEIESAGSLLAEVTKLIDEGCPLEDLTKEQRIFLKFISSSAMVPADLLEAARDSCRSRQQLGLGR